MPIGTAEAGLLAIIIISYFYQVSLGLQARGIFLEHSPTIWNVAPA
jgi:hypothetical protein